MLKLATSKFTQYVRGTTVPDSPGIVVLQNTVTGLMRALSAHSIKLSLSKSPFPQLLRRYKNLINHSTKHGGDWIAFYKVESPDVDLRQAARAYNIVLGSQDKLIPKSRTTAAVQHYVVVRIYHATKDVTRLRVVRAPIDPGKLVKFLVTQINHVRATGLTTTAKSSAIKTMLKSTDRDFAIGEWLVHTLPVKHNTALEGKWTKEQLARKLEQQGTLII